MSKKTPRGAAITEWRANPEALDELCSHIVSGGHLNGFCKERGLSYTSMLRWIHEDRTRAETYARAREDRSDMLADEIVAISDETEVSVRHDGEETTLALDAAAIARNRLRVDARKWVAAKLKPRVYGDKLDLTATHKADVRDLSTAEILSALAVVGVVGAEGGAGEPSALDNVPGRGLLPGPAPSTAD